MVNFEWYRTFAEIYKTGTLTGAAKELLISQPNVSQHLANLESYSGKKLFDRTARKMIPTIYGKQLYARVVESIERLEQVEATFKKSSLNKLPAIYLGAPAEFFSVCMLKNLNRWKGNIYVKFGITQDLMDKLEAGELQYIISTQKTDNKGFVCEELTEEKFVLVAHSGMNTDEFNGFIRKRKFDKAETWLTKQKWVAYDQNLQLIKRFWQVNFGKRPELQLNYIIPDLNVILSAIEACGLLSVIPEYLLRPETPVKILWEGNTPTVNKLYLVYSRNKVSEELTDSVRNLAANIAVTSNLSAKHNV